MPRGALWCSSWLDARKGVNPFFETVLQAEISIYLSPLLLGEKSKTIHFCSHKAPQPLNMNSLQCLKFSSRLDYLHFVNAQKVECTWMEETLRRVEKEEDFHGQSRDAFLKVL